MAWEAAIVGFIGGMLPLIMIPIVEKLKIDDAAGSIGLHFCCGIWVSYLFHVLSHLFYVLSYLCF